KTAVPLLNEIGGLDELYCNLDLVAGLSVRGAKSLAAKLEAQKEYAYLSQQLATIKCDVTLEFDIDDLIPGELDRGELVDLYRQLEFKSWLSETLEAPAPAATPAAAEAERSLANYETVLTETQLGAWLQRLRDAELFSFSTETTSLDYMRAEIVGMSFSVAPGEAAYVPLCHDYPGAPAQLERDRVLEALRPLLEDSRPATIGQNLKYDQNVLANHGITLRGIAYDTMLESYVLDAVGSRHDLDGLALKYLGVGTVVYEDVAGKGAKQTPFSQLRIAIATGYAPATSPIAP